MKLNLSKKRFLGFTLVELLIVISIMAVLAAIIFPKIANFGSDSILRETADSMVSAIRSAQVAAQAGSLCGDQVKPTARAYNWNFQAIYDPNDSAGKNIYYTEAYCTQTDLSPIPAPLTVPETKFSYAPGISLKQINAYKISDGSQVICDKNNNTLEATFDNVTGGVHFADYYPSTYQSGPDPANPHLGVDACDERSDPYHVPCGYVIPGQPNCPYLNVYSKVEYIIQSKSGNTYSIFVDKSGSVTSLIATPTPTP